MPDDSQPTESSVPPDEADAEFAGALGSFADPEEVVVVGERNRRHACRGRELDDTGRRIRAVRGRRVQMEVDRHA